MLKRVASVCAIVGGGWLLGCDANVSNPTLNTTRIKFYQTETNVVYVSSTDTLISVYNDEQGAFEVDPSSASNLIPIPPGFRNVKNHEVWVGQTYAGYSVFPNLGQNLAVLGGWQARAPIQPVAPSACASPPCALIMRGDPGVATNGARVLYSDLAYTDYDDISTVPGYPTSERGPDGVAIAIDETGTGAFGSPFVAGSFSESPTQHFADPPSISMLGNVAVVALDEFDNAQIYTITTDDSSSTTSWYAPMNNLLLGDQEFNVKRGRAIIKLATPTLAYLAYVTRSSGVGTETVDAFVMRLTRTAGTGDWVGSGGGGGVPGVMHFELGLSMPQQAPGAISRTWSDFTPMGFDVGNGGTELHLVLRKGKTGGSPDDVLYVHCLDVGNACDTNSKWLSESFSAPSFSGSRFQPWVAADPTSGKSFAAITWYQERSPGSDEYFLLGATVGSDQPTPHNPIVIGYKDIGQFGFDPFSPCPGGGDQHSFGDYESTAWTPYSSTLESPVAHPHWITTFADSNECLGIGRTDDDAHIESAAW